MESKPDNENNELIISRAEHRYNELKTKAYYVPGVDNWELNKIPQWFDPHKYEKCIYLARKYFVSLYIAHFIGLLMIIQIPSGLAPLLATGNSTTVAKLFRRYLSTLIHVRNWYESNPFKKDTKSWNSMQSVRGMHKRVAQLMNSRTSEETGKEKLWLNQYDFVMTQWAFIGPVILFQNDCGLHPATDEEIKNLNYLWRVIGYCMGIEDQYNLCSDNIEEDRALCQILFDREFKPTLHKNALECNLGWQMGNGISLALNMINPSLSFEAVINYWYSRLKIPHKTHLNSFFKKLSYYYMCFNFQVMLRFTFAHWMYGWAYRMLIKIAIKKKQIREYYLKNKYPNLRFEEKCPLNIDIGYLDAFNEKL